jgi:hypothetical protein
VWVGACVGRGVFKGVVWRGCVWVGMCVGGGGCVYCGDVRGWGCVWAQGWVDTGGGGRRCVWAQVYVGAVSVSAGVCGSGGSGCRWERVQVGVGAGGGGCKRVWVKVSVSTGGGGCRCVWVQVCVGGGGVGAAGVSGGCLKFRRQALLNEVGAKFVFLVWGRGAGAWVSLQLIPCSVLPSHSGCSEET